MYRFVVEESSPGLASSFRSTVFARRSSVPSGGLLQSRAVSRSGVLVGVRGVLVARLGVSGSLLKTSIGLSG